MMLLRFVMIAWLCLGSLNLYAEPLKVVASFSIIADWAKQIGVDKVQVQSMAGADAESHDYPLRPQDMRNLKQAQLVLYAGAGFDDWVKRSGHPQLVALSQGLALRKTNAGTDPHFWHDIRLVQQAVVAIAQHYSRLDPANTAYYQQRLKQYQQELKSTELWAVQQMQSVPALRRKMLTAHDAFAYLGVHHGITVIALQGQNHHSELRPQQLVAVIQRIRKENIHAAFLETLTNPKLLQQLKNEANIQINPPLYADALSRPQGPAASYLALYRYNVQIIVKGLRH